ncbi:MAG: hypothetical protein E7Z92_02940 [Cyanobacteria bacterium SIG31]|nr:hypothetical protein [Cyanobacteria bacterium SIG31]
MLTFKAQLIHPIKVQKLGIDKRYHDDQASFVELNPKDMHDKLCLNEVNRHWENATSLASDIAKDLNKDSEKEVCEIDKRYFALTMQKDDFRNLDYKQILGVVNIIEIASTLNHLKFLQVEPSCNYGQKKRKFKDIGKGIIDSLKLLFPSRDITLEALDSSINFYKKNGFKVVSPFGDMRYSPNNIPKFSPKI